MDCYDNLDTMSMCELDQLLTAIAVRIKEEQWKASAQRLENDAIEAVQALREFTGRNYCLMLGAVTVVPNPVRHLRHVRFDLVAA